MNVSCFTRAVMFLLGMTIFVIFIAIDVVFYPFLVGFDFLILRSPSMRIIAFAVSFFKK